MRLTTFLWLSVALAVAFAAINWLGLAGWLAAIVVLGSIGMHVAGNAIGTRMQEATDRQVSVCPRPFTSPHSSGAANQCRPVATGVGWHRRPCWGRCRRHSPGHPDLCFAARGDSRGRIIRRAGRYLWLHACQFRRDSSHLHPRIARRRTAGLRASSVGFLKIAGTCWGRSRPPWHRRCGHGMVLNSGNLIR